MNSGRTVQLVGFLLLTAVGQAIALPASRGLAAAPPGTGEPGLALPGVPRQSAVSTVAASDDPCATLEDPRRRTAADLRCIRLLPTATGGVASGMAELGRASSPFGVALTPDGRQRYRVTLSLERAPDPRSIGPYRELVAWAVSPRLDEWVNLGAVVNGVNLLGEVALNKFTLMVTAEAAADGVDRQGPLLLRGTSPSSRMLPEDLLTLAPGAILPPQTGHHGAGQGTGGGGASGGEIAGDAGAWWMPPTYPGVTPLPGLMPLRPDVAPWLPTAADPATVPEARPTQLVRLPDGGTLDLEAGLVRRTIGDRTLLMYGFNGQTPGPLIHVPERSTIFVNFTNRIDWPTAIHWHGVRLDNEFDGVPGLTQEPVLPGETFRYRIFFRDAGIYWYHPHHREDIQQDLGLYGNMRVQEARADAFGPVHREEVVMLDDLLVGERGLVPYGREAANFMLMGRFGNVFLVNGEPEYELDVRRGEVVRFFFTNASNTRTFNVTLRRAGGAAGVPELLPMKVVASDVGRFEREEHVGSVTIAPAERYAVDVRFPEAGSYVLANEVQAINHRSGRFFPEVAELGVVRVAAESVENDLGAAFETLRSNDDVVADIDRYRAEFDRPVDLRLELRLEPGQIPTLVEQVMSQDSIYFNPVEWAGTMPMMNWITSADQVAWHLVDPDTGARDMDIDGWRFRVGDVVKIRVTNSRDSFHAMHHPIHIHGQRFLVLEQDGVPTANLVWKDTVLLPVGSTTDLLLELSNPGRWMVHCHIAEHLESGMKLVLTVEE